MKLLFTRLMLILVCFAITACSTRLDTRQYSGTLYFGIGQTISELDMKSRDVHPIYYNRLLVINSLYGIDHDHFLLNARIPGPMRSNNHPQAAEQNLVGYSPRDQAFVFDLTTRTIAPIVADAYDVSDAVYLPKDNAIIFWGEKQLGTQGGMYWIQRSDPNNWHLIDTNADGTYAPVVVSDDAVVYRDRDGRVKMFNLATNQVSVLNITDCYPVLWRSATQQLMCINSYASNSSYFYLIGLDGNRREKLPIRYGPFVYIRRYDLMLLSSVSDWGADLWSYDFKSGEVEKFLTGNGAMLGAVYIPDDRG